MSISIISPFSRYAIGPPETASGDTWPIAGPPLSPPENLPSVIKATDVI